MDAFGVEAAALVKTFAGYSPKPPLAWNGRLMSSARAHSQDMADHDFQGHQGSDGADLATRIDRVGYSFVRVGENVYSYAYNIVHGHAAFLIDWGVPDLGHRTILLELGEETAFREVGIGVIHESDGATAVGPLVVTEHFGMPLDGSVFLTGVAYQDHDGDGEYDPGEGLGGVEVRPDRGTYYAITAPGGGYAIPVTPGSGSYRLVASRSDLEPRAVTVTVGQVNVKADVVFGGPDVGRIEGTVRDGAGQAIAGVRIVLDPGNRILFSDGKGAFAFPDVAAGTYTLDISRTGYTFDPDRTTIEVAVGEVRSVAVTGRIQNTAADNATGDNGTDGGSASDGQDGTDPLPGSVCGGAMVVLLGLMGVGLWLLGSFSGPRGRRSGSF